MNALVPPHGSAELKPLLLEADELGREHKRAETLPRVPVSSHERGDIVMLGIGSFTPLDGHGPH